MGKELEFLKHNAFTEEERVQELRDEFDKQGKDCLDMGGMGRRLSMSYLTTSCHCFEKVLEVYKKKKQEDDVFKI